MQGLNPIPSQSHNEQDILAKYQGLLAQTGKEQEEFFSALSGKWAEGTAGRWGGDRVLNAHRRGTCR